MSTADFILLVHDLSKYGVSNMPSLLDSTLKILSKHKDDNMDIHYDGNIDYLVVLNKVDLVSNEVALHMKETLTNKGVGIVYISMKLRPDLIC